jgi:recombinational DNA repair protein (RecF pathway)
MAKGVRKTGGRRGGSLSTFGEGVLTVQFRANRDLQTFRDFSPSNPRSGIAGNPVRLGGASVLAELVLRHAESEANPGLFRILSMGLNRVEREPVEGILTVLLTELWCLVRELGYGPMLDGCVECGRALEEEEMGSFDFSAGGLRCSRCRTEIRGPRLGPLARSQLRSLVEGRLDEGLRRPKAHLRLASDFVTYHISGGTPLRSMAVLATLIPKSHA